MFVKDVNPKTYCGCKEDSRYFLKENMLSELVTEYQKEQARQNLGIDSSGSIISNIFKRIEKDKDNIIIEYNIIPDKINYSLNSGSPKEIDTIEGTYYKIGITGQSVNDITIETVYTKDNDIKTDISTKKFYGNVLSIDETSSENGVLNIKYTFKDDLGKIDSKQITYNPISNNLLIDGTNAQSNTLDINPTTIDNNLKYQIPVLNRYNRPGKVNIEIESVSSDKPGLITPDDYNTFNEIQSLLTHGDGEIISTGDPFDTEITDSKFTINYNYKNLEGGGESNITIPLVTDTKAGLMSPTQYDNLSLLDNNLLNNLLIGGNDVNLISGELTEGGYKITVPQLRPNDYNPDEQQYEDITIPNVTDSSNGLMLGSDKLKLDSITLDDNNKIDSSMLPSYVDDVVDIAVVANTLPTDNMANGDLGFNTTDNKFYLYNTNTKWIDVSMTNPVETGKIYIATKDGNKQYRWSGTTMVQITSGNLVIGTVTGTAFDGGKGKAIEDWKNLLSTYSYSVLNIAVPDSNKVTIDYNYTTFGTLSSQLRHLDIPTVTTSLAGVMSASDKAKLDSIEENANNYTLPTASVMDLGGIKAGAEPAYDISEEYIAYTNSIGNACIKLPLIGGKSGDVNVNQGLLSLTDYNTFKSKQDALVSGTNIKTINNQSILGSGNINIESGESSTIYDLTKINALTGSSSSSDVQSAFTPLSGGSSPSVPQVGNILRTNDTGYPYNTVVYAQSTDNGEGIKSFKYLSGTVIRTIQVMPDFSAVNVTEINLAETGYEPKKYDYDKVMALSNESTQPDVNKAFTPIGGDAVELPMPGDLLVSTNDKNHVIFLAREQSTMSNAPFNIKYIYGSTLRIINIRLSPMFSISVVDTDLYKEDADKEVLKINPLTSANGSHTVDVGVTYQQLKDAISDSKIIMDSSGRIYAASGTDTLTLKNIDIAHNVLDCSVYSIPSYSGTTATYTTKGYGFVSNIIIPVTFLSGSLNGTNESIKYTDMMNAIFYGSILDDRGIRYNAYVESSPRSIILTALKDATTYVSYTIGMSDNGGLKLMARTETVNIGISAGDKAKLDKITAPTINTLSNTQITDNSVDKLKLINDKLNELMNILHSEGLITKENQS